MYLSRTNLCIQSFFNLFLALHFNLPIVFTFTCTDHGLASNTKNNKTEANVIIGDSQALLKKVAFGDVLGDWNDGILAIGTLGYCDPLKPFNFQNDYLSLKNHEDEMDNEEQDDDEDQSSNCYYNAEDEELSPLMHTKFENNYEDDDHDHVNEKISVDDDDDDEVLVTPLTSPLVSSDHDEITESSRVERITLADLFLADSDDKTISMKQKDLTAKMVLEKPCLKSKNGFPTFSKKPIPPNCVVDKKDKPHPIKQIQKVC